MSDRLEKLQEDNRWHTTELTKAATMCSLWVLGGLWALFTSDLTVREAVLGLPTRLVAGSAFATAGLSLLLLVVQRYAAVIASDAEINGYLRGSGGSRPESLTSVDSGLFQEGRAYGVANWIFKSRPVLAGVAMLLAVLTAFAADLPS